MGHSAGLRGSLHSQSAIFNTILPLLCGRPASISWAIRAWLSASTSPTLVLSWPASRSYRPCNQPDSGTLVDVRGRVAQIVKLVDVDSVVPHNVVGGDNVKIKVGQRPVPQVFKAVGFEYQILD